MLVTVYCPVELHFQLTLQIVVRYNSKQDEEKVHSFKYLNNETSSTFSLMHFYANTDNETFFNQYSE
jgi:hypothetical protein